MGTVFDPLTESDVRHIGTGIVNLIVTEAVNQNAQGVENQNALL